MREKRFGNCWAKAVRTEGVVCLSRGLFTSIAVVMAGRTEMREMPRGMPTKCFANEGKGREGFVRRKKGLMDTADNEVLQIAGCFTRNGERFVVKQKGEWTQQLVYIFWPSGQKAEAQKIKNKHTESEGLR